MTENVLDGNPIEDKPVKKSANLRRVLRSVFFGLAILLSIGAAGYYYWQYSDLRQHPEKLSTQTALDLKKEVSRIILLPDEEPQIAVVQDVDKLKREQSFFDNANNGDKVLIFSVAKKAVLYRPSERKIIEVGPVNQSALDSAESAESTPSTSSSTSSTSTSPILSPQPASNP